MQHLKYSPRESHLFSRGIPGVSRLFPPGKLGTSSVTHSLFFFFRLKERAAAPLNCSCTVCHFACCRRLLAYGMINLSCLAVKGVAFLDALWLLMYYPSLWRRLQHAYAAFSVYRAKTYDTPTKTNKSYFSPTEKTALFLLELQYRRQLLATVRRWIDWYCTTSTRQRTLIALWRYQHRWHKVAAYAGLSSDEVRVVVDDMTASLGVWLRERGFMFDTEAGAG